MTKGFADFAFGCRAPKFDDIVDDGIDSQDMVAVDVIDVAPVIRAEPVDERAFHHDSSSKGGEAGSPVPPFFNHSALSPSTPKPPVLLDHGNLLGLGVIAGTLTHAAAGQPFRSLPLFCF